MPSLVSKRYLFVRFRENGLGLRGPERTAQAFQGMVKASVMHAGESGLPSEAIQHAAAVMTTPEWEEVGVPETSSHLSSGSLLY